MIPDALAKTVLLPVRIRDGKVEYFYGGELPSLRDGTIADLVVPAYALVNQQLIGALANELAFSVLPKRSRLLVGLKPEPAGAPLIDRVGKDQMPHEFGWFAEVILEEQLGMRFRGTKRAILEPCTCLVPALNGADAAPYVAESLNHAYTKLSERFEQYRRSHTGNAFQVVFYRGVGSSRERSWEPLETLRRRFERKIEQRFRTLANSGASSFRE